MPTHSAFLLRKSHGQKSLAGYSSQCLKRVRHEWPTTPLHKIYEDTYLPIFLSLSVQNYRKTNTHKNKRVIKTVKEKKKKKSCAVFQSRLLFKRTNELEVCNSEKNTIK